MSLHTCVTPDGKFRYVIHDPHFMVKNLRENDYLASLGECEGRPWDNSRNFPPADIEVEQADRIYEIANAFPFKGTTFINTAWAGPAAENPLKIGLPAPPEVSLSAAAAGWPAVAPDTVFSSLPEPLLLALAQTSTDPDDLVRLARLCCEFVFDDQGQPTGLQYRKDEQGRVRAMISKFHLFEILANNRYLPDAYKQVMVLRPGAQGGSEIVGEWTAEQGKSHIFEYLRRNSYIPWGHYAANMANDAVRYRIDDLLDTDMSGLRHLYYKRTYVRLAAELGLTIPGERKMLGAGQLEELRRQIVRALEQGGKLNFNSTLWGWNFGFDCAPTGYRLHASHQQIHQQFAMLPAAVATFVNGEAAGDSQSYGCGDLVRSFLGQYLAETGRSFFDDYLAAIRANQRMDGRSDRDRSLVVFEDENVMLFVPKAQTSQWELQLMTVKPVGNILEADQETRNSLDRAMLTALRVLTGLGARMVTSIEYSKRFACEDNGQRLLYAFLPRLPESPGAFSEQQLRWIMGHFPEDFATAARNQLTEA